MHSDGMTETKNGIAPALTPEEWAKPPDTYALCVEWDGCEHQIAALALYGQPFGFTQDDLTLVQSQIHRYVAEWPEPSQDSPSWPYWNTQRRWRELAAKLAALLPPRE